MAKRLKHYTYIGIVLIILGFLSFLLLDKSFTYYIYTQSHTNIYKLLYPIEKSTTTLGNYDILFYVISVVIILSLFLKAIRPYILGLSLCLVLSDSAVMLLKFVLGKARPELFIHKNIYGFYFFKSSKIYSSIPSGHTLLNSSVASFVFLKNKRIGILLIIYAILVGISRIFLLMHYLGDILVSFGIGILISILVLTLEKKYLSSV